MEVTSLALFITLASPLIDFQCGIQFSFQSGWPFEILSTFSSEFCFGILLQKSVRISFQVWNVSLKLVPSAQKFMNSLLPVEGLLDAFCGAIQDINLLFSDSPHDHVLKLLLLLSLSVMGGSFDYSEQNTILTTARESISPDLHP